MRCDVGWAGWRASKAALPVGPRSACPALTPARPPSPATHLCAAAALKGEAVVGKLLFQVRRQAAALQAHHKPHLRVGWGGLAGNQPGQMLLWRSTERLCPARLPPSSRRATAAIKARSAAPSRTCGM